MNKMLRYNPQQAQQMPMQRPQAPTQVTQGGGWSAPAGFQGSAPLIPQGGPQGDPRAHQGDPRQMIGMAPNPQALQDMRARFEGMMQGGGQGLAQMYDQGMRQGQQVPPGIAQQYGMQPPMPQQPRGLSPDQIARRSAPGWQPRALSPDQIARRQKPQGLLSAPPAPMPNPQWRQQ